MPAPVVAAAAAGGGGAGGGAAGGASAMGGGASGGMAQFGKGGQMLGKQGIGKQDLIEQGQQQAPDLDSARSEMKKPSMPGMELGKSLINPLSTIKKGLKMGSKAHPDIGGMG